MAEQNPPPLSPLDYETPPKRSGIRAGTLAIILVSTFLVGVLVVFILLPSLNSRLSTSPGHMCVSNMHQIGLAILLYQNDHQQHYPNTLDELFEEEITPAVFVCPSSNDTASAGATTQAIAKDWQTPGHLSYIYLGKGLDDKATADTVVLYEPLTNHGGTGMNVLFGDGHAEWINATLGAKLIATVASGPLPIRLDVNAGTVAASQPGK